jgi:hypothetical protein
MQTLVAYVALTPLSDDAVTSRMDRVSRLYGDLWQDDVAAHRGALGQRAGVCLWDLKDTVSRWPSFVTEAGLTVASLYAPIGYEAVVGDIEPAQAPLPLARALIESPQRMHALTAPFAFAALDHQREVFHLHNDGLGVARLFQCRTPFGWVWSNRPAAAVAFAGTKPTPDVAGWSVFATSGWFMGDLSPFEGVSAVPPGSVLRYGTKDRTIDVTRQSYPTPLLPGWSAAERSLDERLDETASALQSTARSVYRLYEGRPNLDLSGGRDSRLVSAVFLSAGLDVGLNTDGTIAGEAQTARELVALYPGHVDHTVSEPAPDRPQVPSAPLAERAFRWHQYADGLRMSTYLPRTPPGSAGAVNRLSVGGAGGDVAHGHYYPSNLEEILGAPAEQLALRISDALAARICARVGPTESGRALMSGLIRQVIRDGRVAGLEGAALFDWFWLLERLRRWGGAAERAGIVSPLLSPSFVSAALAMTKAERAQSALHKQLIARLVPEWVDIPFFTPRPGDVRVVARPRLWDPPDRESLEVIIASDDGWSQHFDPAAVRAIWNRVLAGTATPVDEVMLQRLAWYSTFVAYLDHVSDRGTGRVSGSLPPQSPETSVTAGEPPATSPSKRTPVKGVRGNAARVLRGVARRIDRPPR